MPVPMLLPGRARVPVPPTVRALPMTCVLPYRALLMVRRLLAPSVRVTSSAVPNCRAGAERVLLPPVDRTATSLAGGGVISTVGAEVYWAPALLMVKPMTEPVALMIAVATAWTLPLTLGGADRLTIGGAVEAEPGVGMMK